MAWSPSTLQRSEAEELAAVLVHLRQIHDHLRIGLESVLVWRPDPADIERLRFYLSHGTCTDVREALRSSMRNATEHLIRPPRIQESLLDMDLASLIRRMQQARTSEERTTIWHRYEQLGLKLIRPLLKQAETTENPLERNLLQTVAESIRLAQPQAAAIYEKLKHNARGLGAAAGTGLPLAEIKQWLATTKQQLNLIRALLAYRIPSRSRARTPTR